MSIELLRFPALYFARSRFEKPEQTSRKFMENMKYEKSFGNIKDFLRKQKIIDEFGAY